MAIALAPSPSTPIDGLVERGRTDPEAFGELYDRHCAQVYRFIYRRVHDEALTEDLTADVFFKALRNLPRYRACGRPFVCWLYPIAANTVVDHALHRKPVVELNEATAGEGSLSLLDRVVQRDEARRVWQAVTRLPCSQQMVMQLRFADDLSLAEIGGVTGRSEAAVKLLLFRAVRRVRAELGASVAPRAQVST
jgi:RNA polymerase sigma-70 factor (ECF subfamily)